MTDQNIIIFLIQLFLLLGLSRVLGEVLNHYRQPALTAEIIVGVLLGPTILGRLFPHVQDYLFPQDLVQQTMFQTVAWLGAFFFLLEAGLSIDFSSAWRQKSEALTIAITDIVVPMVIGFTLAWFLPDAYLVSTDRRIEFSVFFATILTVSAMPITVRILHDLKLSKTDLGFLILTALSVNDILGWLLFTVVFGFFMQNTVTLPSMITTFLEAGFFVVFCLTWGRQLSNWIVNKMKAYHLPEPAASLTFIFLLGLWSGAIAQKVGLHALFGFFLAGVMAGEAKALSEKTRHTISRIVYALFVPLFFAGIGLKMDFLKYFDVFLILFVAVVGIGIRFLGAWLGVTMTQLPKENRTAIAIAHTPGGMMEIVMGLVALENHLITPTVFVSIVLGALLTAVVVGPWFSWALRQRKHVSVFEFFTRSGIDAALKAQSKEQAIMQLSDIAFHETGIDLNDITTAVLEREALVGTGLEHGVAIPHARLVGLSKPIVIFAKTVHGIEWDSPDGSKSQYIFLVLTPKDDDVIPVQILQAIAKVMHDPHTLATLNAQHDNAQIWSVFQHAFDKLYVERR